MQTFVYFAYGSNMLVERLTARCPRAKFISLAVAPEYQLSFAKQSKDGSGKATIARVPNGVAATDGVLFEIPISERPMLDDAEGADYQRLDDFMVLRADNNETVKSSVYIAKQNAICAGLRPYDWYRDLIAAGARQHQLREDYALFLESCGADPDPNPTRKTRLQAVSLLNKLWERGLSEHERVVLNVAQKLYTALPMDGACYRSAFFLHYHLKKKFGIKGEAKVGFVNDGTDELFSSHAWYELNGQVTDLAISRPLRPEIQQRGPLLILGRELQPGWRWTYHIKPSAEGEQAFKRLLADPRSRSLAAENEALHRMMLETAKDDDAIRVYLDGAPDGLTYQVLAKRVDAGR